MITASSSRSRKIIITINEVCLNSKISIDTLLKNIEPIAVIAAHSGELINITSGLKQKVSKF